MDESVKEIEYISGQLKVGEIVTYQDISHQFGATYKKSKVILYNFYKSNKSNFVGQFIINGVIEGSTVIKFIESEKLIEEAVEKFDKIDEIYCYSVTPKTEFSLKDFAIHNQKNVINTDNLNYYHKLGLIKGPELVPVTSFKTSKLTVAEPTKTSTTTKEVSTKPKKEKTIGLMSNYVSRKQKPADTAGSKRAADPPKYQYKSRKLENKKPEKVVVSNDLEADEFDEFDDMEVDTPAPSVPAPKTKLSDIFNDDDDDEEDITEGQKEENTKIQESEQEEAIPEPEAETKEASVEPQVEPEPEAESETQEPQEPQYDEEGYLITYNTKKPKSKPKPKPRTTTETKTEIKQPVKSAVKVTKDKKSKQPSVMSFFGKKK
ncbi:DNA polymerase delta subunit 3 [[Candida] jaroonii]|uniref:DNA polymerase delta subunit 3 n=1 Tax=[Candida] jaroonii TaxID=467808 RepID=A0ACA9Y8R9_9ASCO|nr:DNA polymerase delta subunit 3 [[Candida] jaroonii]